MISENSRYYELPLRQYASPDGTEVSYLSRRFIPSRDDLVVAAYHQVSSVDRLDIVAHTAYGDPTQFWRIADYALTREPETLTDHPKSRLAIPLIAPSFTAPSNTGDDTL